MVFVSIKEYLNSRLRRCFEASKQETIDNHLQHRRLPTPVHPCQHHRVQRLALRIGEVELHVVEDFVVLDDEFTDFHAPLFCEQK